jgi:hypothetical protein
MLEQTNVFDKFLASTEEQLTFTWNMKDSSAEFFVKPLTEARFAEKLGNRKDTLPSPSRVKNFAEWLPQFHAALLSRQLECVLYALPMIAQFTHDKKPRSLLDVPVEVQQKALSLVLKLQQPKVVA